jgi:hypothetical protein
MGNGTLDIGFLGSFVATLAQQNHFATIKGAICLAPLRVRQSKCLDGQMFCFRQCINLIQFRLA